MNSNPSPEPMRRLVTCPACELQYDASEKPPGSHFHCGCGTLVEVPETRGHDADVVRCSSCGGPRRGKEADCGYCRADFTLHERDLHTICPECMARISDRARFCHHCGVAIIPQGSAGSESTHGCPICSKDKLATRKLGEDSIPVLECGRCGGLWLGHELLHLLQEKAKLKEISWLKPEEAKAGRAGPLSQKGPLYRKCPVCHHLMSRRNFHRTSGVIADICSEHGIWFDLGELDRLLAWIKKGGLTQTQRQAAQRLKEEEQAKKFRLPHDPMERAGAQEFGHSPAGQTQPTFVNDLVDFFLGSLN